MTRGMEVATLVEGKYHVRMGRNVTFHAPAILGEFLACEHIARNMLVGRRVVRCFVHHLLESSRGK